MAFKVIDKNIYELPGTNGRFYHLGSIQNGVKEYICMIDRHTSQCYIEEITGGDLKFIEDDNLAYDLAQFCSENDISKVARFTEYLIRHNLIG